MLSLESNKNQFTNQMKNLIKNLFIAINYSTRLEIFQNLSGNISIKLLRKHNVFFLIRRKE